MSIHKNRFFIILLWILLHVTAVPALAAGTALPESIGNEYEEELEQYDFSRIQDYLNQQIGGGRNSFTFKELMQSLLNGDLKAAAGLMIDGLKGVLGNEVSHGAGLMGQILVLGVMGAVLSNFSSIFAGSQVSETGFFVTYMLMFTFLAASFQESIAVTYRLIQQILEFMKVLLPAYFLSVAMSGASTTSAALSQLLLLVIALVDSIFLHVLLPLIRIYILLILTGHIAKEDLFSKWTELLKNVICWAMKGLIGLVIGAQALQSMILPYVDSMKHAGLQKLVEVVPVIGQGASSVSQLLFGAGVLIKNTMGMAGVVILIIMVSVPIFKLVLLMLLYQCMAAALQPICDKRLISCISCIAEGHKMLLGMVLAVSLLFIIAIALVCISTNTTYLV